MAHRLEGNVLHVQTKEDFFAILAARPVVVVDCFAKWCGPCKAIAPFFAGLSVNPDYSKITFVKVDVDEAEPELTALLEVTAMPTFMAFVKGSRWQDFQGASKDKLTEMCDACVALP